MPTEPRDLVDAYLEALVHQDYTTARRHLADTGFTYRSPIATFDSADAFIEYTGLGGLIIHSYRVRKVFQDGNDVCHFLTYAIQISQKMDVDIAQWARTDGARIQSIELFFDASPYHQMFPQP